MLFLPTHLQKEVLERLAAGKLQTWLKRLATILKENTLSPYFVGSNITIADLQVQHQ